MILRNAVKIFHNFPVLKPVTSISARTTPISSTLFRNFSSAFPASRVIPCLQINPTLSGCNNHGNRLNNFLPQRDFHALCQPLTQTPLTSALNLNTLDLAQESRRTVTHYSIRRGTRKTVKAVVKRFYRLAWGAWIRPRSGRHRHLWRKSYKRKKRSRLHVFCNSTQSRMLDKMVTKFWRERKYYVDDPYESYHKRSSYWITRGLNK